jgi:ribonuclease P protein component
LLKRPQSGSVTTKILISVSKKSYRKAVDRNHIKRIIRESFRLHKPQIQTPTDSPGFELLIALVYTPKEIIGFQQMSNKMAGLTSQIVLKFTELPPYPPQVSNNLQEGSNRDTESGQSALFHN